MIEMLMSLALAFGISFYAFPVIIHVSNERKLFDHPDDFRKIHRTPVPSMGGLGLFAGIIISFMLVVSFSNELPGMQYVLLAALVLFFIGAKDDLLSLTPIKKFLGQILAAAILVFKGGFVLSDMGGIFGFHVLPESAAYLLTLLTIIVIINAYNLIDGVDGLAGSLTLFSSIFFALYFLINGDTAFSCLAGAMAGALLAFLIFNFSPAKIFMGDTGSLILGLFNAVLVIRFINIDPAAATWQIGASAAFGFVILFVPLFDTLRVFSARIFHGVSPFTPDRNHIHHIMLRAGYGHVTITLSLVVFNLLLLAGAYFATAIGSNWLFFSSLGVGSIALGAVLLHYQSKQLRAQKTEINASNKVPEERGSIRSLSFEQQRKAN